MDGRTGVLATQRRLGLAQLCDSEAASAKVKGVRPLAFEADVPNVADVEQGGFQRRDLDN